jgi:thiamine biosynthesis lipoprotein
MPEFKTSRRRFLLAIGAGGLGALGAAELCKFNIPAKDGFAQADRPPASLQTYTRSSWALGTDVSLMVLHADQKTADAALDAALKELYQVEDILSIYRPHSQISRLNRYGKLEHPHAHFSAVLKASQEMAQLTGGKFDVSVQPLWELYSEAKKKNVLPSESEIETARARVDYRGIKVNPASITLQRPGMRITFNGIAQGYAADRVMSVVRQFGIEHALLDTGEITSAGHKLDGSAFRAGIQHPRNPGAFIGVCRLDGRALATSGDYATYFSHDFVYNHIFDPATGRSPREFSSITTLAPSGMLADALSTAVFVLGKDEGIKLVESTQNCDALMVLKSGAMLHTKGFPLV